MQGHISGVARPALEHILEVGPVLVAAAFPPLELHRLHGVLHASRKNYIVLEPEHLEGRHIRRRIRQPYMTTYKADLYDDI